MSLDNLKLDADALGIAYRSDIKEATLQKKIDKHNNVLTIAPTAQEFKQYRNTTSLNIFTEDGRCSPTKTVRLTADEALKYSGLELCQE